MTYYQKGEATHEEFYIWHIEFVGPTGRTTTITWLARLQHTKAKHELN